MNKFKYTFKVKEVNTEQEALANEIKQLPEKELLIVKSKITELRDMQVSIILEDNVDFPNEGLFFAKVKAEDKASEAIATILGVTFGGTQKHLDNYVEEHALKGRFVECEIIAIEQVL
jgi:hypothetical protein